MLQTTIIGSARGAELVCSKTIRSQIASSEKKMDLEQHAEQLEKEIDSLGHLALRLQKQRDDYEKRIVVACGIIDKWIVDWVTEYPYLMTELMELRALLDEGSIPDKPDQDDADNFRDGTISDGMRRYNREHQ